MKLVVAKRLQAFTDTGSMGIVTDTRFIRCYWPALDRPTALFADGSSGIEVLGSARNIIFPKGTKFLDFYPDALYPAELAVLAHRGPGAHFIDLTDEEAAVWQATYDKEVAGFPSTHAVHSSRDDVHFLVHREPGENPKKPEHYIAELTKAEAHEVAHGRIDEGKLRRTRTFVHRSHQTPLAKR